MKKAVFLYNTQSGKGRIAASVDAICAVFREHGYDIRPQGIDFAKNPFDGNETIDLMVAAGGDGTVNYVVNSMKRKGLDIPVGVVPAGTANDFAGALGMSRTPLEAARQIAGGTEQVDCGRVNGLYFVNIFSFGLFTTTSQRTPDERKHKIGKLAYIIEGVKEFASMHAVPLELTADGEKSVVDRADIQRRDGRRLPPGAAVEPARRAVRLHRAGETRYFHDALDDAALPDGWQPEADQAAAGADARHRLAGRRTDRRRRAEGGAVPAARRVSGG